MTLDKQDLNVVAVVSCYLCRSLIDETTTAWTTLPDGYEYAICLKCRERNGQSKFRTDE